MTSPKADILEQVSDFDLSSISGTEVFEEPDKVDLISSVKGLYQTAENSDEFKNFLKKREIPAKAIRILFSVAAGAASFFLFGHDNFSAIMGSLLTYRAFAFSFQNELQQIKSKWLRENKSDELSKFREDVLARLTPQAKKRVEQGKKPQKPLSAISVNAILSGPRSLLTPKGDENV